MLAQATNESICPVLNQGSNSTHLNWESTVPDRIGQQQTWFLPSSVHNCPLVTQFLLFLTASTENLALQRSVIIEENIAHSKAETVSYWKLEERTLLHRSHCGVLQIFKYAAEHLWFVCSALTHLVHGLGISLLTHP